MKHKRDHPLLFDPVDVPPIARRTDPNTSHQAAAEVAPKLGEAAERMLETFAKHDGITANEAAQICRAKYGGNHETFRKRAGELERAKRITITGERACELTGKSAQIYGESK